MNIDQQILAHGGAMGTLDALVGLGPLILGGGMISAFILLLATGRSSRYRSGYRDEAPTSGRLLFSGTYFHLEEMLKQDFVDDRPSAAAQKSPEITAAG